MWDMLPLTNQPYNDDIFNIAAYKLIDQVPGLVIWTLDNMMSKLPEFSGPTTLETVLPMDMDTLRKEKITVHFPGKQKVPYFWAIQKLMQLLLWNENSPARSMGVFYCHYRVSIEDIYHNAIKIQQILSNYANHSTHKSGLLNLDNSRPVENNDLPSYQNVIDDQRLVGTSDSHLTPHTHQNENSTETNGHSREHLENSSSSDSMLSYCFDGYDKLQARKFINDYDSLAFRSKWSPDDKMEFFPNHLEDDALNWYLSIQDHLTSWKILKKKFMEKYLAN